MLLRCRKKLGTRFRDSFPLRRGVGVSKACLCLYEMSSAVFPEKIMRGTLSCREIIGVYLVSSSLVVGGVSTS